MKKTYIQPSTLVMAIETEGFIAESLTVKGNAGDKAQLSRQSAGWDDED